MKKYFMIIALAVFPMFATAQRVKVNENITIEQCNDSIKHYKEVLKVSKSTFNKLYNEGTRRLVKEGKDSDFYYLKEERMKDNISRISAFYTEIGIPMKEAMHNEFVAEEKIEAYKQLKKQL